MSSRTKLAIIIGSVVAVIVSLVVCIVLVKGIPDVDDIKNQIEKQSFVQVTKSEPKTKRPKATEATTRELTSATVTNTETTVFQPVTENNLTTTPSNGVTSAGKVYLTSVSLQSLPNKVTYYIGDSFSTSGSYLTARYSDGSSRTVTGTVEQYPDMYTAGSKSVAVYYSDSYGNKKYTNYTITVKTPSVSLSSTSVYLDVGETYYGLYAETDPQGLSVSWVSSSPSIASVDSSGNITARNSGSASITASISYKGRTYTSYRCTVTVSDEITTVAPSTLSIYDVDWYECTYYDTYVRFDDISGYISSNYYLDYVEIGLEGPVYINGNYDTIEQSFSFYSDDITSTRFDLNDYYYDFDYIYGEDYILYVYAEDESGEYIYDEWNLTLD